MTESGREKVLEEALQEINVYAIEESEGTLRLAIGGKVVASINANGALGVALLKFDAARRAALASPSTQEPALRVEEEAYLLTDKLIGAMRQVVPFGTIAQDDLLHHLEPIVADALRTYAGESAAQSERAGLEKRIRELEAELHDWRPVAGPIALSLERQRNAELKQALTAERQRRESAEAALKAMADFTDSTGDPWDCPYCHDPMAWHNEPKEHDADCVFEVARQHFSRYAHADGLSEEGKGG